MLKKNKLPNLLDEVGLCIDRDDYSDTFHATLRRKQRNITLLDMLYVLKNGWHEKSRDRYDELYDSWNYAIRGQILDEREVRVIISFDENVMMIITVVDLSK